MLRHRRCKRLLCAAIDIANYGVPVKGGITGRPEQLCLS